MLFLLVVLVTPVFSLAMEVQYVKRVVDGDTILLNNHRLVRYIGINAPETAHGDKRAEPFGDAARKYHLDLLANKRVFLAYDREKTDRYGRTLAYVYTHDKELINRRLLEQGWAYCLYKKPNIRYHQSFLMAQRYAMQHQKGMWRGWKVRKQVILGNKRSRRFHRQNRPPGHNIARSNRIFFSSIWEAFWEGYAPCRHCFPMGPHAIDNDSKQ